MYVYKPLIFAKFDLKQMWLSHLKKLIVVQPCYLYYWVKLQDEWTFVICNVFLFYHAQKYAGQVEF